MLPPSALERSLVVLWGRLGLVRISMLYREGSVPRFNLSAPVTRRRGTGPALTAESGADDRRFAWRHANASSVWQPPSGLWGLLSFAMQRR